MKLKKILKKYEQVSGLVLALEVRGETPCLEFALKDSAKEFDIFNLDEIDSDSAWGRSGLLVPKPNFIYFLNWCMDEKIDLKGAFPGGFFALNIGGWGENAFAAIRIIDNYKNFLEYIGVEENLDVQTLDLAIKRLVKNVKTYDDFKDFVQGFLSDSKIKGSSAPVSDQKYVYNLLINSGFNDFDGQSLEFFRSSVELLTPSYIDDFNKRFPPFELNKTNTFQDVSREFQVLTINNTEFKNKFVLKGVMLHDDSTSSHMLTINVTFLNGLKNKDGFGFGHIELIDKVKEENRFVLLVEKQVGFNIELFEEIFNKGLYWFQKLSFEKPLNSFKDLNALQNSWSNSIGLVLEKYRLELVSGCDNKRVRVKNKI